MPKNRIPPHDVIATRELSVVGESEKVVVELGAPKFVDTGEAQCPYRFTYRGATWGVNVGGVDQFQALQLALKMLPVEVRHLEFLPLGRMYFFEHGDDMGFSEKDGVQ